MTGTLPPLIMRAEIAYVVRKDRSKDDKESRIVSFVASTQGGVITFGGRQHLLMSGADLKRFKANPIILFNHNPDMPIGRSVKTTRGTDTLTIDVEFGSNLDAQKVEQDVADGIVRAMSIAFIIDRETVVFVEAGDEKRIGNITVTGPATVVRKWELYEASIVTVPADANALKRAFDQLWEDREMDKPDEGTINIPVVEDKPDVQEKTAAPVNEIAAAYDRQRVDEIRAIAPRGMDKFADSLILADKSVEEARAALITEQKKLYHPVGTPDPVEAVVEAKKEDKPEVTQEMLARSLCSPNSDLV